MLKLIELINISKNNGESRVSVADVVQIFKGGTSRVIRTEFPELEEFLWGDSLWADGYFAETIGQVDEEVVKKYIRKHLKAP